MTRITRELIKDAKALGCRDVVFAHGGKHPRLNGVLPDATQFNLIYSESPSCSRAGRNTRARLKRMLRAAEAKEV